MIKPIVLTAENDAMELHRKDERDENSELIIRYQQIGRHIHCWGSLFMIETSPTHHAIVCQRCSLRIAVGLPPRKERYRYSDLRRALEKLNPV